MAYAIGIQRHGVQKKHGSPVGEHLHYAVPIHCKA
jgi:hypothetical protein